MMINQPNNLDPTYQNLLKKILTEGIRKEDRTGTGTISLFGTEIRHKMSEGFPLLTSKKMFTRGVFTELEWFLKGGTNIKYLLDKGVNIWNGDAYKNYVRMATSELDRWLKFNPGIIADYDIMSMDDYVAKVKSDAEFAEKYANLGPIYGHQWRNYGGSFMSADGHFSYEHGKRGIDQLGNAVNELLTNPDNRRIKVDAWNPKEIQYMALPPCHTDFQLYSRELTLQERIDIYGRRHPDYVLAGQDAFLDSHNIPRRGLWLKWHQRSVDTFLGLPFNIASYGLLLAIIAQQVKMEPMELIGSLGDIHIYLNHIEQCEQQIANPYHTLPTINLDVNVTIDNFETLSVQLLNYKSEGKIEAAISN